MKTLKQAYGTAEGPFGFPMPDDIAKAVDALCKTATTEAKAKGYQHCVKLATGMDFVDGERADVSFITTETKDRDNEVVIAKGGDFSQFTKNANVTWCHQYDQLPIGRCMWLSLDKSASLGGIKAKTQYHTKPDGWTGDWMPDAVWHLVKQGALPGKSIGFMPLDCGVPRTEEVKAFPGLAGVACVHRKWVLLEYAVAPIQCNPDATVQAVSKAMTAGIIVPDALLAALGMYVPKTIAPIVADSPQIETPKPVIAVKALDYSAIIRGAIGEMDLRQCAKDSLDKIRGRV
jgi:hypothetical protein